VFTFLSRRLVTHSRPSSTPPHSSHTTPSKVSALTVSAPRLANSDSSLGWDRHSPNMVGFVYPTVGRLRSSLPPISTANTTTHRSRTIRRRDTRAVHYAGPVHHHDSRVHVPTVISPRQPALAFKEQANVFFKSSHFETTTKALATAMTSTPWTRLTHPLHRSGLKSYFGTPTAFSAQGVVCRSCFVSWETLNPILETVPDAKILWDDFALHFYHLPGFRFRYSS
jgi:hypothetical protein